MLRQKSEIIYKVADTADESRQIHRLNYLTFVQEIPQHPTNPDGILVDKFHEKNTYIIAKRGAQLLGMVSFCSQPPYSLHAKLADLDAYLPQGKRIAEIRLLSIAKKERKKKLIAGLLLCLHHLLISKGIDIIIASGVEQELKLYRRLGFKPFGHRVVEQSVRFQPIMLEVNKVTDYAKKLAG